jgi:membrane-bound lytic murein transglycosylase B
VKSHAKKRPRESCLPKPDLAATKTPIKNNTEQSSMVLWIRKIALGAVLCMGIGAGVAYAQPALNLAYSAKPFGLWMDEFRANALSQGISQETLDRAAPLMTLDDRVVTLDRKQPESTLTFTEYKRNVLPQTRITKGRSLYWENRALLERIAKEYNVPANYIVALWGMETSFGANKGNFSIITSLTTLAYEGRRAEFFQAELVKALRILEDEKMYPEDLIGSWAGAMGHCQFMPSSFLKFAVDYDNDGRRDIWNSLPDAFASIANYLKNSGWNGNQSWGREVRIPANFDRALEDIEKLRPLAEWKRLGVTKADGSPLPDVDIHAALIFAGRTTPDEGVYLIYPNYHVLLDWNRSRYFATSVGLLADHIH